MGKKSFAPPADFMGMPITSLDYLEIRTVEKTAPTIMAHCVHSTEEEIQMIKRSGRIHCALSAL